MVQGKLVTHPVFALAQRSDTPTYSGHVLANGQIDPLDKCCIDLPTTGR
jgi:hypothetical protein